MEDPDANVRYNRTGTAHLRSALLQLGFLKVMTHAILLNAAQRESLSSNWQKSQSLSAIFSCTRTRSRTKITAVSSLAGLLIRSTRMFSDGSEWITLRKLGIELQ